jgi:hypothetical protein
MGTLASVPDVQPSQLTSTDAPQPTVAEAQTMCKASTYTEAQPKRQKSVPIPTSDPAPPSQPKSADATKQVVDPPAQGTSSAVISQGPTIDGTMEELSSNLAPVNPEAKDIPSTSSADPSHGILQVASSSQRQEITLKQVSRLTEPIYNIHTCPQLTPFLLLGTRLPRQSILLCH